MRNTDWIPEFSIAFERHNDLLREAQQERLARLARPQRPIRRITWLTDNAVKTALCSLGPLHATEMCAVPVLS